MFATSSICVHTTPLGEMWSHWTEQGLYRLSWESPNAEEAFRESPTVSDGVRRQMDQFENCLDGFYREGCES